MSSLKESERQRSVFYLVEESCQQLVSVVTPDGSDETILDSNQAGALSGNADQNQVKKYLDSDGKESSEFWSDCELDSEDKNSSHFGDLQNSTEEEVVVVFDGRNCTDLKVHLGMESKNEMEDKNCKDIIPANQDPSLDRDPLRASYVRSLHKAQLFKGVLFPGHLVQPNSLVGLDDFEVRDDDVFIIAYPRSGTTWAQEIVSLILNGGDTSKVKNEPLKHRAKHLEFSRTPNHLQQLCQAKSPRIIASHLPLSLLPKCLRQGKCKIIYIVRNPKDTAISYYHFHRMIRGLSSYKGNWNEFLDLYMRGYLAIGSWFDHVLPYWRFHQKHPDRMFFTSYEDLKLELPEKVSKMACFLDRPLTPDAIEAVSNHCTFEQMENNNMMNIENYDILDLTESRFLRKGVIGDWRNYFTKEQNRALNKLYNEKMEGSGLTLIFDHEEIDNTETTMVGGPPPPNYTTNQWRHRPQLDIA